MDIDAEEAAWDTVRDHISIEVESGEFTTINKKFVAQQQPSLVGIGIGAGIAGTSTGTPAAIAEAEMEEDEAEAEDQQMLEEMEEEDQDQQPGPSKEKTPRKAAADATSGGPSLGRRSLALKHTIESLLGQANLEHARGHTEQAMQYLFQVIKMSPYHVQTYKEMADIYAELNQQEKSFEFRMLAALLLDYRTPAEEWDIIADAARTFGRYELAVASLAKAIRRDPGNWLYYEKRIQILDQMGDIELAMKTRLQAAQEINCQSSQISFAWIDKLIKTAADYFCTLKDEEKATEALETFILRSREFGRSIDFEHIALLGMWIGKGRFADSAKSILALHQEHVQALWEDSGEPAIQIHFTNVGYLLEPFPPPPVGIRWRVEPQLATPFLAHLIVCLIHLSLFPLVGELIDRMLERPVGPEEENAFLEIARSFHAVDQVGLAIDYMNRLRAARPEFAENADAWFLYGYFYQLLEPLSDIARNAYERVIQLQPGHIDARINLSTILQHMGQTELALETLKDLNLLDSMCSQIPDERLLIRQAEVFLSQKEKKAQYISSLRMLLIPHFYAIHLLGMSNEKMSKKRSDKLARSSMRRCSREALRGTPLERMVKRLGAIAHANQRSTEDLSSEELADFAFKLAEALFLAGEYEEMLSVVCYAFLHPRIAGISAHAKTFSDLLFFASIKARCFSLSFEYLRFYMSIVGQRTVKGRIAAELQVQLPQTSAATVAAENNLGRVYAAINFILCQQQSVNYHRFIMRQLVKQPDCDALHVVSGNNSLVTGAYRHALGEYFGVWLRHRADPLLALLIGLTFAQIACKKDISSRHVVAIRALAFMNKYAQLRAPSLCQEVQYNMGRLFHQMGVLPNAVKCYERVLYECPTPLVWGPEDPEDGTAKAVPAERYDLRRQAAYNLSLIYEQSGNRLMARHILEEFCTI